MSILEFGSVKIPITRPDQSTRVLRLHNVAYIVDFVCNLASLSMLRKRDMEWDTEFDMLFEKRRLETRSTICTIYWVNNLPVFQNRLVVSKFIRSTLVISQSIRSAFAVFRFQKTSYLFQKWCSFMTSTHETFGPSKFAKFRKTFFKDEINRLCYAWMWIVRKEKNEKANFSKIFWGCYNRKISEISCWLNRFS